MFDAEGGKWTSIARDPGNGLDFRHLYYNATGDISQQQLRYSTIMKSFQFASRFRF